MEKIITNFRQAKTRDISGRQFLVAPITLIVEGVLNGSKGPIFYSKEVIARNVDAWHHVPIILRHPDGGGSARTPEVLSQQQVGNLFNARVENDKLVADGYFDVELANRVDPRILAALRGGNKVEVSVGVQASIKKSPPDSIHNNEPFEIEIDAFVPDHLAILLDNIGACNLEMGCGLYNEEKQMAEKNPKKLELIDSLITSGCCWEKDDEKILNQMDEKKLEKFKAQADKLAELEAFNEIPTSFTDPTGSTHVFNAVTQSFDSEIIVITDNEWLEAAPESIKFLVADAEATKAKEKEEIVNALTQHLDDEEKVTLVTELNTYALDRLQKLAKLAPKKAEPVANYFGGKADVPSTSSKADEEVLSLPTHKEN